MVTREDLDAFFAEGWNRHDVDRLMTFMTDDCVFERRRPAGRCAARVTPGASACARPSPSVFTSVPRRPFRDVRHVVAGDRGLSEWVFRGHQRPTAARSRCRAATCSRSAAGRSR